MKLSLPPLLSLLVVLTFVPASAQTTRQAMTNEHQAEVAQLRSVPSSRINRWNAQLSPSSSLQKTSSTTKESAPIEFQVLSTHSREQWVSYPAEFPDLPPVEGQIKVTIQEVADPGLPELKVNSNPSETRKPLDPEAATHHAEFLSKHKTPSYLISATIYPDEPVQGEVRSHITMRLSDDSEDQTTVWSNLDLRWLQFVGDFNVIQANGKAERVSFMLSASLGVNPAARELARRHGVEIPLPIIPSFSSLNPGKPCFVVEEGDPDTASMHAMEQLHALFLSSGAQLKQQYHAHLQARKARKQYLIDHPEKPKDLTIRFWRIKSESEIPNQDR